MAGKVCPSIAPVEKSFRDHRLGMILGIDHTVQSPEPEAIRDLSSEGSRPQSTDSGGANIEAMQMHALSP